MLLRVTHRTGYEYAGGATASYNEARMTPKNARSQQVLHTKLEVEPAAWTLGYTDYWGTSVTAFEVHERHERLTVTSSATVDVRPVPEEERDTRWDDLHNDFVTATHAEYLGLSEQVRPPEDLAATVREIAGRAATPTACVDEVVGYIHDEMKYVKGATGVHTHARDAWQGRAGVCQDIANLTIGCLRTVGIPTCYVSGYLMPAKEPEVGETYRGESHAWVRWWDGEWVGADPTNLVRPGERHVEVAQGRQYGDVPPLRGIFTGSGTSSMFVEVELTRIS